MFADSDIVIEAYYTASDQLVGFIFTLGRSTLITPPFIYERDMAWADIAVRVPDRETALERLAVLAEAYT